MESIGFKEWAIVCRALGSGEQSIIPRKGGLAEGGEGFSFQHREFFLFPTYFHEQVSKVRQPGVDLPEPRPGGIEINFFAKLEIGRVISSWAVAAGLEHLHILQTEVVRERFEYEQTTGLHVAFVRIFRITPAWIFPDEKRFGGCRSWVNLPRPPADLRLEPVLSETEHERRKKEFLEIVGDGSGGLFAAP